MMGAINFSRGSTLITFLFAFVITFSDARPQKHYHHNHVHGHGHGHGHYGDQNEHTALSSSVSSIGRLATPVPQVDIYAREVKGSSSESFNAPRYNLAAADSYEVLTSLVYVTVTVSPVMQTMTPSYSSGKAATSNVVLSTALVKGVVSEATSDVLEASGFLPRLNVVHAADLLSPHSSVIGGQYQSFKLNPGTPTSTSASAALSTPSSICPAGNGTTYTSSGGSHYQIICNINIVSHDFPYQLAGSFDACVAQCDLINKNAGSIECLAAIFVPHRQDDNDDCYLKYSTANQVPSTVLVEGAILQVGASTSLTSSTTPSSTSSASVPTTTTSAAATSAAGVTYALGNKVVLPEVAASHLQGPSQNRPSTQYVNWKAPPSNALAKSLLTVGVEGDLSIDYALSLDTGVLEVNSSTQGLLADLTNTPHISRDGGKGGYLNGQHLFIFCDTGSYTTTTDTKNGDFLGFVSSSCATDTGMNGLYGNALHLEDGIGQWSDNAGRMRGFAPLTQGEESYNLVMQGDGHRYAVWPESSLIPLDTEHALIYAPIVYDAVNMATRAALFTYTGTTLLTITAGGKGGPVAQRTVDRLFNQDEVEWGCVGGIRSWGASGVGGTDGKVYIFGSVAGGLLLARTGYGGVTDRNNYEYWTGSTWSNGMLSPSSTAYFIRGSLLDVDIFYSPRHLTFIAVYMTKYADSTFCYRYLKADAAILPPYAPGGNPSSDYVENLVKYDWSEEQVLYKATPGAGNRYIYSGGVHQGYYGADDITNGGPRMLISWTAPTGEDPSSAKSEYQLVTAEIAWA